MTFVPSPQQKDLFNWVSSGKGNAFVQAVAGAGKTTSLIESCKLMKGSSVAFLAYNKKIVEEIKVKLAKIDSPAQAGTFHSFGFQAWRKVYPNVKLSNGLEKTWRVAEECGVTEEYAAFVAKAVSLAKQRGLGIFGAVNDVSAWMEIVNHFDLQQELAEFTKDNKNITVENGIQLAMKALELSKSLCTELIDFDDMIYAPVVYGVKMFQFDYVLVDEAQDTNPARRALAKKMVKPGGRVIFVGDKHQAIYGFTGADSDAVDQIVKDFACTELPLTVTYRCPKTVVKAAQAYVSHIQAHETAPEGVVESIPALTDNHFKAMTATDAILCRLTKPLVELAFSLIRQGIACHVEGRDIGSGLIQLIQKWKRIKTVGAYLDKLGDWESKQIEQMKVKKNKELAIEQLQDRVDTVRILCQGCTDLSEVKTKIERMFVDQDAGSKRPTLTLSTVHKSKGREWHNVYILGFKEHMPSKRAKQDWQKEQENNLIYVAMTRAQSRLFLVG